MKIILPKIHLLVLWIPMLYILAYLLSFVMFSEHNLVFCIAFTLVVYFWGVYSYSITIKKGYIYAKNNVFKIMKDRIKIEYICKYSTEKIRKGESYLYIKDIEGKEISIYSTFFYKKQIMKLKNIIKDYMST